jgi:type VI secretion system protein ImpI
VQVLVYGERDGSTSEHIFGQFPVRIGRVADQNDLVLNHQYISQRHAEIHLVDRNLTIVQIGRSNSVLVDDHRLTPDEKVRLTGSEIIRAVPFRLTLKLVSLPEDQLPPRRHPPQTDLIAPLGSEGPIAVEKTDADPTIRAPQTPLAPAPAPAAPALAPPAPAPQSQGGPAPAPAPPSDLGQSALQVLGRFFTRYTGQPLQRPEDLIAFGERLEQVLETCIRFFIALQRGQEQFRQELDLKVPSTQASTTVTQANDVEELAGALLAPGRPNLIQELEGAFHAITIHQVALLSGMMAGVRKLLSRLSPKAIAKEAARQHRSLGPRALWQTFEQIHRDLAEEGNETFETVFGPQFAKAYAKMLKTSKKKR